ncbi:MAG TPA: fibronectin type III domain-containing protein [Actinomycetota bacterium]|nr:fibronectin type III domain-containing protein [Actinomycetota bacterium]
MRIGRIVLGTAAAVVLAAGPAMAGVGYSVQIDEPGTIARGAVAVRAHAAGGVGDAEYAAYHVGPAWSEGAKVPMDKIADAMFRAVQRPWDTAGLPNGTYRLEVRIWGDVPPYDPGDANTFARQVLHVSVDNAPPAPANLSGAVASRSVRLRWAPVATADRSDFLGYRVLRKRAPSCAGASGYVAVAETSATAFTGPPSAPGSYCFRVAALRSSEVSGVIASAPSAPLRVAVAPPSGAGGTVPADPGFVTGSGARAVPPPPPALRGGKLEVSDGAYGDRLPYGPRTVTQGVDVEADGAPLSAREAGPDPRQAPTLIATGLILAVAALLVRRFLAGAPAR